MGYHRLATPGLDRIFRGETVSGLSEWQLLERYLERRDEVAFEALVARHGPMVLAVCRRMLVDQSDVDDAFQATFLVLVRRARQLGPRDAIGPWLHGVAARVAMRARSEAARRRRTVPLGDEIPASIGAWALVDRELGEVLDQELSKLPSKYRSPIVLCYMEGRTHEEAARQLEWPLGTVKGRLSRARDMLRSRLARRGLAPSTTALTLVLARDSRAALHRELIDRTVNASLKLAMGHATTQVVSASIASLVEGVLNAMLLSKLKWAGALLLVSGLALTGAAVSARQDSKALANDPTAASNRPTTRAALATEPNSSERSVEPAGPELLASNDRYPRVADLRSQLVSTARAEWAAALKDLTKANGGLERAYQAARRLKNAEELKSDASPDKTALAQTHFRRIREIARVQHEKPSASEVQLAQMNSYVAEAELELAMAQATRAEEPKSPGRSSAPPAKDAEREPRSEEAGGLDGSDNGDPQSQRILKKLDDRITMAFHDETPLEDVLKYIKETTISPEFKNGIPIYVDPVGMQEAEKSMTSTVRSLDLEGVPLRRTLQLALKQLDLVYFVQDGMLFITSEEYGDQGLPQPMRRPSLLMQQIDKAEKGELQVDEMKDLIEKMKLIGQIDKLQHPDPVYGGEGGSMRKMAMDSADRNHELIDLLLKETRELLELLKTEKQERKPSEPKAKNVQ
jgi:RNA polymerase sigma factor (sigma-70 family)